MPDQRSNSAHAARRVVHAARHGLGECATGFGIAVGQLLRLFARVLHRLARMRDLDLHGFLHVGGVDPALEASDKIVQRALSVAQKFGVELDQLLASDRSGFAASAPFPPKPGSCENISW